jgi:hypothetical protein
MKSGQWTDEQIVAILQEAAKGEKSIATVCREKASRKRLSMVGARSLAVSTSKKRSACENWRKRTLA